MARRLLLVDPGIRRYSSRPVGSGVDTQVIAMVTAHVKGTAGRASRLAARASAAALVLAALLAAPDEAHASFLSPELEDKLAGFLAIVILFIVPIVLIVLFWMVHVLPEKIAHKRHHPQFEAIRTLCLLSLVFGGLLWPIAWIWAYSKPVLHKLAYGTDKVHHDEEYPGEEETQPQISLHERLARLEGKVPESELKGLRSDLEHLESKFATSEER
jgi:hypothetical protein